MFYLVYKSIRKLYFILKTYIDHFATVIVLSGNKVSYSKFTTRGIPNITVAVDGKCSIAENLTMNNGAHGNPIGLFHPCTIFVDRGASLIIGCNVASRTNLS
jgi:hypothetical protein